MVVQDRPTPRCRSEEMAATEVTADRWAMEVAADKAVLS